MYTFTDPESDSLILTNELKGAHTKSIRSVAFCPRRMKIAAASFDGTVSVWASSGGTSKWTCIATLDGHENEVKAASWGVFLDDQADSEQVFLSTCGRDKTVWVWAMEESLDPQQDNDDFECLAVLQEHEQDVKCLAWHPRRPLFLTGSYDKSIMAFGPLNSNLDDWVCFGKVAEDLDGTVWSLAFSSDEQKLSVALSSGKLILFTLPQNWSNFTEWIRKDVQIFDSVPIKTSNFCNDSEGGCNNDDNSDSCCKSSKNNENSSHESESENENECCGGGGSNNNKMQVDSCCSSSKKVLTNSITIPAIELYNLSWNPAGTLLAIACSDHSIKIVNSEGEIVHSIEMAHDGEVNCLSWCPKKEGILASVGDDGKVKIWKIQE